MEAWESLVNTALLGAEKAPAGLELFRSLLQLQEVQRALNERGSDAETKLLETTAVLYLYRAAA